MRRTLTDLLIVFVLLFGGSTCVVAQSLSADRFLERVSAHPVGDEAEHNQAQEIAMSLNSGLRAEVEKMLPAVMAHVRSGGEVHVRAYAGGFLVMIAMRADGAALLSSSSKEISSLIVDANPGIQEGAVAIADYVMGKAGTDNRPYVLALRTAIQTAQTPQESGEQMILLLLDFDRSDPEALKSVLTFMQREDLTRSTRVDMVHHLGVTRGLPTEVNRALTKELDDPDPWVRAAAVAAFADSTTEYHTLAKDRVERMANDPQEHPQVHKLAKEAMAGKTHLDPNIYPSRDKLNGH